LIAASLPALFAGCAGTLLPQPPAAPSRFTLDGAATTATSATPATAATPRAAAVGAPVLVVDVPRAAAGHDSTRMVYLRRPQELEAFAFHEWVDTPAQMLAPLMVRSLQDSGAFRVVLRAPSAASGGLRLETELIRLQQDFGTRPSHVRLTLRAVLMDTATRQAVAWQEFDETVPSTGDDPVSGVVAAHLATQRMLAALVAFCVSQSGR
jgi:cholesterol transport system auxiliary component